MLPTSPRLVDVAEAIAREKGIGTTDSVFRFAAKPPASTTEPVPRRAVPEVVAARRHEALKRALYRALVETHGESNVSVEQQMACRRPADIVVRDGESQLVVFEIKTAMQPRECLRQAIGQLLEYAFWPGSPPCREVVVVGPVAADGQTHAFVEELRERFAIPLRYQFQRLPKGA